jgi:hypothetical protein
MSLVLFGMNIHVTCRYNVRKKAFHRFGDPLERADRLWAWSECRGHDLSCRAAADPMLHPANDKSGQWWHES